MYHGIHNYYVQKSLDGHRCVHHSTACMHDKIQFYRIGLLTKSFCATVVVIRCTMICTIHKIPGAQNMVPYHRVYKGITYFQVSLLCLRLLSKNLTAFIVFLYLQLKMLYQLQSMYLKINFFLLY